MKSSIQKSHSMKTLLLSLTFLFLNQSQVAYAQAELGLINDTITQGKLNQGLDELDQATGKKWEQLEDWQRKESWVNEQLRLGAVGVIYEKGMLGGVVSRNLVPDRDNRWLVIDKLQISAGPLLQIGNLAGNLFFQHAFPYVQVGADLSRTYVNVRKRDTYKQALLADPFEFKRMPVHAKAFQSFENGELVSTVTEGGFYVRMGASIFDLMGIAVVGNAAIGPRAKVHVAKQLRVTIAKQSSKDILVMIEDNIESGLGLGITTGVSIDDLLDVPVAIGINQGDGYSPIRLNYKIKKETLKSVIYKLRIDSPRGQKAYYALMNRDFSLIDDLADQKKSDVVRELTKVGQRTTEEFNAGVDLIFYRSGFRDISVDADFRTVDKSNRVFTYKEVSAEAVDEVQSYDGAWHSSEKYTAIVPTSKDGLIKKSFVLDSTFSYTATESTAEDMRDVLNHFKLTLNHMPVSFTPRAGQFFSQVHMTLMVRFPASSLLRILRASDREMWLAMGVSANLADPERWVTHKNRVAYQAEGGEGLEHAQAAVNFLRKLRRTENRAEQARMLVNYMKADESKFLHRSMIEIAGRDQLIIQGRIKGLRQQPKVSDKVKVRVSP